MMTDDTRRPGDQQSPDQVPQGKTPDRPSGDPQAPSVRIPPAGPHDVPELTNPIATLGTGTLPPPGQHDDVDSVSS
jgi:hypothetical protein